MEMHAVLAANRVKFALNQGNGASSWISSYATVWINGENWEVMTPKGKRTNGIGHESLDIELKRLRSNARAAKSARMRHAAYTSLGMKRTPYGYE